MVDLLFMLDFIFERRRERVPAPLDELQTKLLALKEPLIAYLSASPNLAIRTEIAMLRQLDFDRNARRAGTAPMRGPFYEEGEIVRHLESADARLVARHLELIERSRR